MIIIPFDCLMMVLLVVVFVNIVFYASFSFSLLVILHLASYISNKLAIFPSFIVCICIDRSNNTHTLKYVKKERERKAFEDLSTPIY